MRVIQLLCVCLCLSSGSSETIFRIDPSSGKPGDRVSLLGAGFDPAKGYTLTINGIPAGIETVNSESISFRVPTGAKSGVASLSFGNESIEGPIPFFVERIVEGLFSSPTGNPNTDYSAATVGGIDDVAPDGKFTAGVTTGITGSVWVFAEETPSTFVATVTDSDAKVVVNAESTALSAVVLNPLFEAPESVEMDALRDDVRSHPKFDRAVRLVESAVADQRDYFDDDEFLEIVAEIVADNLRNTAFETLGPPFLNTGMDDVQLRFLNPGGIVPTFFQKTGPNPGFPDGEIIIESTVFPDRPNSMDWTIELHRLSPELFPEGFDSMARLTGMDAPLPANSIPVRRGFKRGDLVGKQFDLLGRVSGAFVDSIFGGFSVPKSNEFSLSRYHDEIYVLQSYSGNLPNGLGLQAGVLDLVDPNSQWTMALTGNLLIVALDTASAFGVSAKDLTGIDNGFIADASVALSKSLTVYRARSELDTATIFDLARTIATSLVKSVLKKLDKIDAKRAGALAARMGKAAARFFDVIGRVSSGIQAAERLLSLSIPTNLALERSIIVVGNPFQPFITSVTPSEASAGTSVSVDGGNFSWLRNELDLRLCSFESTTGDIAASIAIVDFTSSPTRITFDMPEAEEFRSTFSLDSAFVCVVKDGVRAIGGPIVMPAPPMITAVEPPPEAVGSMVRIPGTGFGSGATVKVDNNFDAPVISVADDHLVAMLPFTVGLGTHTVVVSNGNDHSEPFPFTIQSPFFSETGRRRGATIKVTRLDTSNVADGEISLMEAFLLARGELSRPLEQHVEDEPPGTSREVDHVAGLGGANLRDTVSISDNAATIVLDEALPVIGAGDRFLFNGLTIDGSKLPAAAEGLVCDGAESSFLSDLNLVGFKANGIRLTNGSSGVVLQNVSVADAEGNGLVMEKGSEFNRLEQIEVTNVGGNGVVFSDGCDRHTVTSLSIGDVGGHGLYLRDGASFNSFSKTTIRNTAGDGVRMESQAESNRFVGQLEVNATGGAGIRLSGAEVRYNQFYRGLSLVGAVAAFYEMVATVTDAEDYGIVLEDGAAFNAIPPKSVVDCEKGGVLIREAGGNTVGRLYHLPPSMNHVDPIVFSVVADNNGPGATLVNAQRNVLTGLSISGNGGDAIFLDNSSNNHIQTVRTGFQEFFPDQGPFASPNRGHGIHLKNGSNHNEIAPIAEVSVFESGGRSASEAFPNIICNETGDGIRIDGGSNNNRIRGTNIGGTTHPDPDATYLGGVGGNGICIRGESSHNQIGKPHFSEQLRVDGVGEAGIVIEGAGTVGNQMNGVTIGSKAFFGSPTYGSGETSDGDGIILRDGANDNIIGMPGPLEGGFGVSAVRPTRETVIITDLTGTGITISNAGGDVGTDKIRRNGNLVRNCRIVNCDAGIHLRDNARVNDIGGPRGGRPRPGETLQLRDTFTEEGNLILACRTAGLRYTNIASASPLLRNRLMHLDIEMDASRVPAQAPDLRIGPPEKVGILIDPDCQGEIVGEDSLSKVRILDALVGVYVDGATGNTIRGTTIMAPGGRTVAGIVLRNTTETTVGDPGESLANRITSLEFPGVRSSGIEILGGDHNTISANTVEGCGNGIRVLDSSANLIGGLRWPQGNVIVSSAGHGIVVEGAQSLANRIQYNTIGTDRAGNPADPVTGVSYGNSGSGVQLGNGASNNLIGGDGELFAAGATPQTIPVAFLTLPAPNVIRGNGDAGVFVDDSPATGNSISDNSIFANDGGGIVHAANARIPVPTGVSDGNSASGQFDPAVMPAGSTVQIFSDRGVQGELLIGETVVDSEGRWDTNVLLPVLPVVSKITATVTDAISKTTSEFGLLEQPGTALVVERFRSGQPLTRSVARSQKFVALDLRVVAFGEPIRIRGLGLTLDDQLRQENLLEFPRLYSDEDADGRREPEDRLLGTGGFVDPGVVRFTNLNTVVDPFNPERWLVVFALNESLPDDAVFSLHIDKSGDVSAEVLNGENVRPSNPFPVNGDFFKIGDFADDPFAEFMASQFSGETDPAVIGFYADPDHDGVFNGLEWVLAGDPAKPDAGSILPQVVITSDESVVFRFRRRANLPMERVTTSIEVSAEMTDWDANSPRIGATRVTEIENDVETVETTLTRDPGMPLFARMQAEYR